MDHFGTEGKVFDSHSIATDVVDGFERKSFELLEYINALQAKLDQQRCLFKERERQLEEETVCVEQKFKIDLQHAQHENARLEQDRQNFVEDAERSIQSLRKDVDATDLSLRKEGRRVQDLQNAVTDLKYQLLQKQLSYNYHKSTHEKEMGRLEEEVNNVREKASLGWILGRLTEGYLRMRPLQQPGRGSGSVDGTTDKVANMHGIEEKVRRLIDFGVHSPRTNDAAMSPQPGRTGSDGEEPDPEKPDEFERRVRYLRSISKTEGRSPGYNNRGKQQSNIIEGEVKPSKACQSGDEEHNFVETDIEIMAETERRAGGNKQNSNIRSPNASATMGLASPPSAIRKSGASSLSPPRSPKKDVTWFDESSTTVNSNASVHRDISNRQRDIHHSLISTMKSQTKLASNL